MISGKSSFSDQRAHPWSGRATACGPGRSEAEPWEGMLLKSQARPLSGRATADRILLSPAQKADGLFYQILATPGLRFAPPWATGCRPPKQRAGSDNQSY